MHNKSPVGVALFPKCKRSSAACLYTTGLKGRIRSWMDVAEKQRLNKNDMTFLNQAQGIMEIHNAVWCPSSRNSDQYNYNEYTHVSG